MIITENTLRQIIRNSLEDFYRGFKISDEEPTDYKGVLERCGYKDIKGYPQGNTIKIVAKRTIGVDGFHGDVEKDAAKALGRIYPRGARYLGSIKDAPYKKVFEITL